MTTAEGQNSTHWKKNIIDNSYPITLYNVTYDACVITIF